MNPMRLSKKALVRTHMNKKGDAFIKASPLYPFREGVD